METDSETQYIDTDITDTCEQCASSNTRTKIRRIYEQVVINDEELDCVTDMPRIEYKMTCHDCNHVHTYRL